MNAQLNKTLDLRAPVIVLILAGTAVPVELRSPIAFGHAFQLVDFLQNIAGYVPLGFVLGGMPAARALLLATAISLFAESSQSIMLLRDPSIVDVIANVTGSTAGVAIASIWRPEHFVPLRRWTAVTAALLAIMLIAAEARRTVLFLNPRGATATGVLEAHWSFDEPSGTAILDTSPHGLHGTAHGNVRRVRGVDKGAIDFDGVTSYIDIGKRTEIQMTGSLTVSAWIRIRSNPADDAAIVSTLFGSSGTSTGFQLDTTKDTGPRTIGFKLGDSCGKYFARYGATALSPNTWHFVTGVYDARARTIDVFLDGRPDNGVLAGVVPGARRTSHERLNIGQRSDFSSFGFIGALDEVRIYSRALDRDEVAADMNGQKLPPVMTAGGSLEMAADPPCRQSIFPERARLEDARLPASVALVGILVSFAFSVLGRTIWSGAGIAFSAASGLLLLRLAAPTLPAFNSWTFPLLGALAGVSVVMSARPRRQKP